MSLSTKLCVKITDENENPNSVTHLDITDMGRRGNCTTVLIMHKNLNYRPAWRHSAHFHADEETKSKQNHQVGHACARVCT
jgi:hypothetical protein